MDYNKILESIILTAIPLVIPFILAAVFSWLKLGWAKLEANQTPATDFLFQAAHMAVTAAEQYSKTPEFALAWESKKEYALVIAQNYLDTNGIEVDAHLIEAAIESAVKEFINKNDTSSPLIGEMKF
jgi:D-alanyl-D-alanine carboxypeptidase